MGVMRRKVLIDELIDLMVEHDLEAERKIFNQIAAADGSTSA